MNNTSMKTRICLVVKLDVRPCSTPLHLNKFWCRTESIKKKRPSDPERFQRVSPSKSNSEIYLSLLNAIHSEINLLLLLMYVPMYVSTAEIIDHTFDITWNSLNFYLCNFRICSIR